MKGFGEVPLSKQYYCHSKEDIILNPRIILLHTNSEFASKAATKGDHFAQRNNSLQKKNDYKPRFPYIYDF